MPPLVALTICAILVMGLMYVEHKKSPAVSLALWIPTIWTLIQASRPLGRWFQYTPIGLAAGGASFEAGSPLDRLTLSILILGGLLVLFRRRINWSHIAKDNFYLILICFYAGMSILWSEIPSVSFKRWFRLVGDILIALVVLSERMPLQALESIMRRCAYVLIPFSLVLVRYFGHLGRDYSRWSGGEMWTGVTVQKNSLGQLCALSIFILIWALLRDWRSGKLRGNALQTFADVLVIGIAIYLLRGPGGAYSATSISILFFGLGILFFLSKRANFAGFAARHLRAFAVSLVLIFVFFYELVMSVVLPVLGREETLTGRTELWAPIIEFASQSPFIGTGYGGLWAPENREMEKIFGSQFIIANAHSGYLAVYLELGIIGIVVLSLFLLAYCAKVRREIAHSFEWGVLGMCLLPMSLLINYTEVSYMQSQSYFWSIMVLVMIVFTAANLEKETTYYDMQE